MHIQNGFSVTQNTKEAGKSTRSNKGGVSAKVLYLMIGLAAATSSGTGIASAEDNANVTDFDLITETILNNNVVQVTSPDGVTWDTIVPDTIRVQLNGQMKFRWRNGRIERGAIYLGKCPTNDLLRCSSHPRIAFEHRDHPDMYDDIWYKKKTKVWKFNHEATFSTSQLLTFPVPGFNPDLYLGTQILEGCNQRAESGERSFTFKTKMTVSINTVTGDVDFVLANPPPIEEVEFDGGDQTKTVDFDLNVSCDVLTHTKQPKTTNNQDLNFDQGSLKVNDIKMTLTTYSNAYTEPTPGTQCKKAKLRVTMETNQIGLASFKLYKMEGGFISNEDVTVSAYHDDGKFFAVHERWLTVNETTNYEFNARDLVNETFYNETGWKSITLNCSSPGGGGLASPDNDDGSAVEFKYMTGGFTFIDNSNAAKKNRCERSAKALVWFDAPKNDNIHYSLDCGELGNFSGVLQPTSIGNGKFRAGKLINFQVTETIQAGCTLRTVSPGAPKDHAFKSNTFQCARTAGHSSGIDGVVAPTSPQAGSNGSAILPKLCKGGKIRYGVCQCPKGTKRKKIGDSKFACKIDGLTTPTKPEKPKKPVRANPTKPKVKTAPVRTNPKPKKAKLVCVGGKVRGSNCKCGPNKVRKKLGKRKFQCLAVAKPIKPKKKKPIRVNPKLKKKALICKGGKVRGNRCVCPKGKLRKKQGKRKFLCYRPAG